MNDVIEYERPFSASEIKDHVQLIQQVMADVMKKDVHYGTIPGTQKPTLYKPGAEKLLSTFRIGSDPSGESITDLSTNDEIRYRVAVKGFSQATSQLLGVGIGECSSNEAKYKWRSPVCDEEFEETPDSRKRIIWKKGKKPYQQKQIRTEPSDVANTILKMAKKRAQIDMTLTVTAASDVFDQDLEDLPNGVIPQDNDKPPLKKPEKKKPQETTTGNPISDPQCKRFYAISKGSGKSDDEIHAYLKETFGITSSKDIQKDFYETACEWAAERIPGAEG